MQMTRGPKMTYCNRIRAQITGLLVMAALVFGLVDRVRLGGDSDVRGVARAAEPANVEALIRQGNILRTQGKDTLALPYYQKAYETERNPRTAAQLGLVEASLGYWLASERHLSEGLATNRHPWVERMRGQLETALKTVSERIGEIEITGSPENAEVVLNNKVLGTLPMRPVRLEEGPAQIIVRAPGFVDHNVNLTITGGKRESLVVDLPRGGGTLNVEAPPVAREPSDDRPLSQRELVSESLHAESKGTKSGAPAWVRPTSWVAAALGVTALGIGTYQFLEMRRHEEQFNKYTVVNTSGGNSLCAKSLPRRGGAECERFYENAVSAERLAMVGFQVGGVLAVASIIGFVWSANSSASAGSTNAALPSTPDLQLAIDPSGASAGLHWRF
jgi:hypothetical protein